MSAPILPRLHNHSAPQRNKECPTCRKKLVSKRSLRPDPNFDALIAKIYPSREEYEAHQEKVLAKWSKTGSMVVQQMMGPAEEGSCKKREKGNGETPLQAEDGPFSKRSRVHSDAESGADSHSVDHSTSSPAANDKKKRKQCEVELLLRPHPSHSNEEVKYLKTITLATVDHLTAYLAMRDSIEQTGDTPSGKQASQFRIFIQPVPMSAKTDASGDGKPNNVPAPAADKSSKNTLTPLENDVTLAEISQQFWSGRSSLELVYQRLSK